MYFNVERYENQSSNASVKQFRTTPPRNTMGEKHGILNYNSMFSLPHFHFQMKSVNISIILTSKLKMCVYIWRLASLLSLGIDLL